MIIGICQKKNTENNENERRTYAEQKKIFNESNLIDILKVKGLAE